MRLLAKALAKYLLGLALVSALLFLPAGTLAYPGGWLFIGLLFLPMLLLGTVLFIKSPELLEKRLSAKEKEDTQKSVLALSALLFIAGFVIAGLDHRYAWSRVPTWAAILAAAVLLISYALYAEVMRENAYLSRTVEVQEGQQVVDTGLYGIVRHPMYAVTLWLFLSIPVVLGSWWSLLCFVPYAAILVLRIQNEEKVLTRGLPGYAEYKTRVKYRLIPFIW
ncbi:MAG: isoprenylcysteine carboxylmethyltransferase family protein [Clostridia bacterium]|nr:isoprenylcysteine carboxylmethyltransferase family protein [Clostridia bacterium]